VAVAYELLQCVNKRDFATVKLRVGGDNVTERRRSACGKERADLRRMLFRRRDLDHVSLVEISEVVQPRQELQPSFRAAQRLEESSPLRRYDEGVDAHFLVIPKLGLHRGPQLVDVLASQEIL